MQEEKRDAQAQDQTDQEKRLEIYQKIARNGYPLVLCKPGSEMANVPFPDEILSRVQNDAELGELSKRDPDKVRIMVPQGTVGVGFGNDAALDDISAALGPTGLADPKLDETVWLIDPGFSDEGIEMWLFRSSEMTCHRKVFWRRNKMGTKYIAGILYGPGSVIPFDEAYLCKIRSDDLPEVPVDDIEKALMNLEGIEVESSDTPMLSVPDGTKPDPAPDEPKPAPEGRSKAPVRAGRAAQANQAKGESRSPRPAPDEPEPAPEDLSKAPAHKRILAHMEKIGVETHFNMSTGNQEFRGGFVGDVSRPANERIIARILKDVPGGSISTAESRRAFSIILSDREVVPQGEVFKTLTPTDDMKVYEELFTDRFIAECQTEYAVAVFRAFLASVVRMSLRPGHVQRFLPALFGSRRSAMSALLRGLCQDQGWYTNSIPFAGRGGKPSEAMRGKMIGEVPLDKLDAAATSTLDAVVTHDTAHPRMPAAGGPDDLPQFCGLIGTAFNFVSLNEELKVNPRIFPLQIETELADHEVERWARTNAARLWGIARRDHESERPPADMPDDILEMREQTVGRLLAGDELPYGSIERYVRSLKPGDQITLAGLAFATRIPRQEGFDNLVAYFLKNELGFTGSKQRRQGGKREMVWTVPDEIRPAGGPQPNRQKPKRRKG